MGFLNDRDLRIGKVNLNRLKNKYIITALVFIVWIAFFDENNWVERAQNLKELRQLHNDKEYYIEQIGKDAERLKELKTNDENLEKYAREQYLMKKEDEVVFVIVEE
jgi:cell division protein FtsB